MPKLRFACTSLPSIVVTRQDKTCRRKRGAGFNQTGLHVFMFYQFFRTELMRRMKRYQIANYKCLVVKYSKDDRYDKEGIATHDR